MPCPAWVSKDARFRLSAVGWSHLRLILLGHGDDGHRRAKVVVAKTSQSDQGVSGFMQKSVQVLKHGFVDAGTTAMCCFAQRSKQV